MDLVPRLGKDYESVRIGTFRRSSDVIAISLRVSCTSMDEPTDDRSPQAVRHVHRTVVPWLEIIDAYVYAAVGAVFLIGAVVMLIYSVIVLPSNFSNSGCGLAVVTLVNDLLLVMIIMEVLRTIISYLQEHGTSLQPFLFIAAISATRRILAVGAQMSVAGHTLGPDRFREAIIDLAANAGVILAIAIALYLLRRPSADTI
jgi:uncharacterized membrane protein (DUF373 family)